MRCATAVVLMLFVFGGAGCGTLLPPSEDIQYTDNWCVLALQDARWREVVAFDGRDRVEQVFQDLLKVARAQTPEMRGRAATLQFPPVDTTSEASRAKVCADGSIYVPFSSFASVDNERYLASLLAHEIGHLALAHHQRAAMFDGAAFFLRSSAEEAEFLRLMYEDWRQFEADRYGMGLLAITGYDCSTAYAWGVRRLRERGLSESSSIRQSFDTLYKAKGCADGLMWKRFTKSEYRAMQKHTARLLEAS